MNEREFYKRIQDLLRPELLQRKLVIVVGVGSGGSRFAVELGRLGVELVLVDRPGEKLEEHNIVRHVLGYDSLGRPKTTELARHILNLNPKTRIRTIDLDVVKNRAEFEQLVKETCPTLLAACTDNEPSKHIVNEIAVPLGIPQIGAGVYDSGVGGEIWVGRTGQACYACIADHLKLNMATPKPTQEIDYNSLDLEELHSTPALNLDISQIALIQARVALNLMINRNPDLIGLPDNVNLLVFSNRLLKGVFSRPLHGDFYKIRKREECLVCGTRSVDAEAEAGRIIAHLTEHDRGSEKR